jgi:hypothetical protein
VKPILIIGISISEENQKYLRSYFAASDFLVTFRNRAPVVELSHLIDDRDHDFCLLLIGDTWFGPPLAETLPEIIRSYDRDLPNWGIASNAGSLWTGESISFRRLAPYNPRKENSPRICLTVEEPLLLINVHALREAHVDLPITFSGSRGIGAILSVCCLEREILALADSRLFAAHNPLPEDDLKEKPLEQYRELTAFLEDRYLNHRYTVRGELLDLGAIRDQYEYLELPPPPLRTSSGKAKTDLLSFYDRALLRRRKEKTRLEIVTRTVLGRRGLLERALSMAELAHFEAPETLELHFRLVSDRDPSLLERWTSEFKETHPRLPLSCSSFTLREGRFSRTDILLQAIETSKADFIWFIDDDDFIFPSSLHAIGRALADKTSRALIGPSVVYEEQWDADQVHLQSFEATGIFLKEGIFKVLTGENYIPICSMILPVPVLKDILRGLCATGDYLEDYFLLLSYLSSSVAQIELLETPFAGISIRGDENTVRKINKAHWEFSYAQVFEEILNSPRLSFSPHIFQFMRNRS